MLFVVDEVRRLRFKVEVREGGYSWQNLFDAPLDFMYLGEQNKL